MVIGWAVVGVAVVVILVVVFFLGYVLGRGQ
jgi:hypothetical protein